ncbi:m protein repeat protein [Colletotrichum camelliae]|nr:m protein repeat protein [Colletotrichum camelliae]
MTAPAKSSRWGSFLQQAVAGVEARLDNILAEGENGSLQQPGQPSQRPATPSRGELQQIGPSRSSTSSRTNDRLQERLAKAMASKNPQSSDARSATSDSHSARLSVDSALCDTITPQSEPTSASNIPPAALPAGPHESDPTSGIGPESGAPDQVYDELNTVQKLQQSQSLPSIILGESESTVQNATSVSTAAGTFAGLPGMPLSKSSANGITHNSGIECSHCVDLEAQVKLLEASCEHAAKEQQEEIHRHVEQFEALQAKVQFLAKEATDVARKSAAKAPAGSQEQKLAERDEKIALLMEEGRNLAATEQKHRTIIRKLRSQIVSDEKATSELKTRYEKTAADLEMLRSKSSRVEELEHLNQELQIRSNGMQDDLNALRAGAIADKNTIEKLRADLQKATDQANSAFAKANDEALAMEKRRAKELEDTIAALQVEKTLVADRAKASAAEVEEKASRATELARITEAEMKAELQVLEGKLEAMRALAEEASSGAVGDSQAKLLRQVETLQTQHAIATENWQGIEASLLARLGSLERERDDALRRESEMRKKARETATRCKRQDEEIQELTNKFPNYQRDVEAYQSRIEILQRRADETEAALARAKLDLEKQHAAWKAEKTESERRPWLEDHLSNSISRMQSRPDSPLLSVPTRTLSNDLLMLQSASGKGRKISTPTSGTDGFHEGSSPGRRSSAHPPSAPFFASGAPSLPGSAFPPSFDLAPDSLPTPTSHACEKDDLFDGVETTSSPRQMMQDMVSVSTVGAGPSVQLVERMSAAIRRLEAEKVTSREELARISGQRDEARAEIAALMKEMESCKAASKRVAELEVQVEDINSRYQMTLEVLGEKSELVEELRADVQDVKAMYRDLVERTVR